MKKDWHRMLYDVVGVDVLTEASASLNYYVAVIQ